ncbi:MAG: hypothetical protein RLT05_33740 [Bauldia litoralis]
MEGALIGSEYAARGEDGPIGRGVVEIERGEAVDEGRPQGLADTMVEECGRGRAVAVRQGLAQDAAAEARTLQHIGRAGNRRGGGLVRSEIDSLIIDRRDPQSAEIGGQRHASTPLMPVRQQRADAGRFETALKRRQHGSMHRQEATIMLRPAERPSADGAVQTGVLPGCPGSQN